MPKEIRVFFSFFSRFCKHNFCEPKKEIEDLNELHCVKAILMPGVFQRLQSSSKEIDKLSCCVSFFLPPAQVKLLIGPLLRLQVFKSSLFLTLLAKINYILSVLGSWATCALPLQSEACIRYLLSPRKKRTVNGVNLLHLTSRQVHDPKHLWLRM